MLEEDKHKYIHNGEVSYGDVTVQAMATIFKKLSLIHMKILALVLSIFLSKNCIQVLLGLRLKVSYQKVN